MASRSSIKALNWLRVASSTFARALRCSAEPACGGGLRPTCTVCQWLCLKSQQGLGLIPFFSPENSPFGANDRAWARGPRPCQRPRPSLLLSNKGWGQRPTVKMAPGRLQDAAVPVPVPVPVRLRAREWSRKATPSADMAPDLASASQ